MSRNFKLCTAIESVEFLESKRYWESLTYTNNIYIARSKYAHLYFYDHFEHFTAFNDCRSLRQKHIKLLENKKVR